MFCALSQAQEPKGFRYHDSLTYNLYLEGRWNDLTEAAKDALSEGHDFYYMRMRLGIAWYERSFYAAAARQFRKALEFNANDPVATEYLFYCRLLSGEFASASRILSLMTPEQSKKVLDESNLAKNSVWLSFYYNDYETDEIAADPSSVFNDSEAGTTTVTRLLINPSVSMSHRVSPGVYYTHSFNNITKQSLLHYYDGIRTINLSNQKVLQNQYYGSITVAGAGGFSFRPWVHLSLTLYDYILAGGSMSPGFYSVRRGSTIHYSAGANLRQRTGYVAVDASVAVNKYGNGTALQGDAGVVFYPLGNGSLYGGGRVTGVLQPEGDLYEIQPVYTLSGGFSFPGILSLDVTAIDGSLRNSSSGNGLYIFNSPDYITRRLLFNLSVPLKGKSGVILFAGGGLNQHMTSRYSFDNTIALDQIIEYKSYNINGGILWNF
jgi:hypothetical protein